MRRGGGVGSWDRVREKDWTNVRIPCVLCKGNIYHKGFSVSTGDGRRRICGEELALWDMGEGEECQEMAERGTDGRGT